jgi:hypothetical protein
MLSSRLGIVNRRFLVIGAIGIVGPSVVHALHLAGYQIRSFLVDIPEAGMLPQGGEELDSIWQLISSRTNLESKEWIESFI